MSARTVKLAAFVAIALWLAGCEMRRPEEEPAYIKATALEARVAVVERQAQGALDLQRQIEVLQGEVRGLRGSLEEAQHEAQTAKAQNRDLYADLDRRITALEARGALPVSAAAPPAAVAGDRDSYQSALDKLKGRDYPGAEKALLDMIARYPGSPLADNAQYWLGETYYVEKRYADALGAFQRLIKEHPDSRKVPDALLKAGYSVYELKRYKEARDYLGRVLKQYPDSNAATEARERLKRMDAENP
jgi:tol-pal system protein YbgF